MRQAASAGSQRGAGMVQRRKQGFVQEFVPQTTVETFGEGILGRLARRDVMPVDLAVIGEGQDRVRSELGPIVADHRCGFAPGIEQGCQFPRTHPPESEVSAIIEQTKQVLANLDAVVHELGASKADIASVQVWLADMADFQGMNAVWDEWVDCASP